jgi:sugar phosphate isomerase/epimerase
MRIGVDTYSYHRLLGLPRPGEQPAATPLTGDAAAMTGQARALGCDVVSLQACFLGPAAALDVEALHDTLGGLEPIIAWGHPEGLAFGTDRLALDDLLAWIDAAAALGARLVRLVVGGPRLHRPGPLAERLDHTRPLLRRAAAHATDLGVELAVENHGDLSSTQLAALVEGTGVGVCFDTANAARVGEDAVEAAHRLAPLLRMAHVKDVAAPEGVADRVAGPSSVPFGTGTVPLAGVLDALAGPIAAGAPMCVEIGQVRPGDDETALVEDGVRWLRAWEPRATA